MNAGIIYLAVNRVNGKVYVGKTGRSLPVRIREHLYDSRNKGKTAFSRAVLKHGIEAFTFTVLETCHISVIDDRERFWISTHGCRKPYGYNLTDGGDGCLGMKRPDTTARNSGMIGSKNHAFGKQYTAEERKRFGQPGKRNARHGIKLTPEFKAILSEKTKTAMWRPDVRAKYLEARSKPISEGTRERMRVAARLREARKRSAA